MKRRKEPFGNWSCEVLFKLGILIDFNRNPAPECGCIVRRMAPRTRLTVDQIMSETNITVRMAQAHCYGLERFLIDAKAKTLDTHGEYSLLSLPMGQWQEITALKMTCPSTSAVYISPVEPHCRSVASALDWYFQTEDYLGTLKAES